MWLYAIHYLDDLTNIYYLIKTHFSPSFSFSSDENKKRFLFRMKENSDHGTICNGMFVNKNEASTQGYQEHVMIHHNFLAKIFNPKWIHDSS